MEVDSDDVYTTEIEEVYSKFDDEMAKLEDIYSGLFDKYPNLEAMMEHLDTPTEKAKTNLSLAYMLNTLYYGNWISKGISVFEIGGQTHKETRSNAGNSKEDTNK